MSRIFIDTAPFIYLFEQNGKYCDEVFHQISNWIGNNDRILSSVITLTEILVHPIKIGQNGIANKYKHMLTELLSEKLLVIDEQIADKASSLRVEYNLSTPDSIQLAAAINSGCDIFYTNDKKLSQIKDLDVLMV